MTSAQRSSSASLHWPLHIKDVHHISWAAADDIIVKDMRLRWENGKRYFTDRQFLEELVKGEEAVDAPEADISADDVKMLLSHGCITPFQKSERRGMCKVFSVDEPTKRRRRLICWPFWLNSFDYEGEVSLCDIGETCSVVKNTTGARLTDMPWYFGQFVLAEDMRPFYTFRFAGECFALCTIPTGSRACPEMAQALTHSVASTAVLHLQVTHSTYIDNARFAGEEFATQEAMQNFLSLFISIGATTDEEPTPFLTEYEFLGIHCDHTTRSISVASKTLKKLHDSRIVFDLHASEMTMRQALAMIARLIWASRVQDKCLANRYWVLKWLRRRCSANWPLDDAAEIWPCIEREISAWFNDALLNKPRSLLEGMIDDRLIIFTDACLTGWGCTLIDCATQRVSVRAGIFVNEENIALLEARAVWYAVRDLPMAPSTRMLHIIVDNTTVLFCSTKGRSRAFCLNNIIGDIHSVARLKLYSMKWSYIKSELNPADGPSRGGKGEESCEILIHLAATCRATPRNTASLTTPIVTSDVAE